MLSELAIPERSRAMTDSDVRDNFTLEWGPS